MERAAPVRVARAVWVSAAILTSRVLGLVRDQLFAALVGANRFSDAFVVAFRLPNLLRDLFAEGALSSAFVPAFAEADRNRGAQAAHRLASAVLAFVLVAVGTLVGVGELFAGPFVRALAPGLVEHDLAARLTREMMPFLLLVSLSAVAMGMLNARSRFTVPALAPALFNVGAIVTGLLLFILGYPPERAVLGWAAGTLLGGVLQLSVQLPALYALGFRFRPRKGDLADPGVRRMFGLMGAAVLGLSATQVNIVVNTIFASREVGATTWLQCAFRLMQLPLGVFGVAIATVAGAGVAQRAAAKDMQSVKETLGSALRLLAFLNVPSAVGLAVLSRPIIGLVYQHGRFAAQDTLKTADALVFYAIGLYAYSGVKVLGAGLLRFGRGPGGGLGELGQHGCQRGREPASLSAHGLPRGGARDFGRRAGELRFSAGGVAASARRSGRSRAAGATRARLARERVPGGGGHLDPKMAGCARSRGLWALAAALGGVGLDPGWRPRLPGRSARPRHRRALRAVGEPSEGGADLSERLLKARQAPAASLKRSPGGRFGRRGNGGERTTALGGRR